MWVLIAVFQTMALAGEHSGVAFQEFSSKETCEAAIVAVRELRLGRRHQGETDVINMRCLKK